jgi:hypothetical protein
MNTNYTKGLTTIQVKELEKNIKATKKAYEEGNIKKAQSIADKRPKTKAKPVDSKFTNELKKIYNITDIPKTPSKEFEKLTGLSVKYQNDIINRGKGAYLTVGSRPNNQSSFSWSTARLYAFVVKTIKNKDKNKINQDNDIFNEVKNILKNK